MQICLGCAFKCAIYVKLNADKKLHGRGKGRVSVFVVLSVCVHGPRTSIYIIGLNENEAF